MNEPFFIVWTVRIRRGLCLARRLSHTPCKYMTRRYISIGGSGPAIIFLHGFSQDWYEFSKVDVLLAGRFTVIAVTYGALECPKTNASRLCCGDPG